MIGGGIVGNSLAGWLTELGWTDLVQVDKGPFPNPGGSTGHASNFIFPVDHSKEMTQLTLESMRQYRETGTLHECGGIEVARTEERLEELRRRMASAKSWGVEDCRLVTPAEIKELVPFVDESILLGGFYTPSVAVVDSLRFGTIMRERAQAERCRSPREHRGRRDRRRGRARAPRPHHERQPRRRHRRDRVRRVGPAGRADGRRLDPAHARRAPDDRRRPRPPLPRLEDGGRLPDRARHGHQHVRAPGRAGPRGRLLRPPPDPPRPRRDPFDRGVRAHPHRAPVHAGGLRAAARARAPARPGGARRRVGRDQVRDQRPALAHARRPAPARRDAGGQRLVVGGRGLGQGRPRRRQVHGRVDGARRAGDRPPVVRRRALLSRAAHAAARQGPRGRGLQQDVRHRPSGRAVGIEPRRARLPLLRAGTEARRRLLRGGRLGAAALVRVERAARRGVRRPAARARVGRALVVADHQRRAPRDARAGPRCST